MLRVRGGGGGGGGDVGESKGGGKRVAKRSPYNKQQRRENEGTEAICFVAAQDRPLIREAILIKSLDRGGGGVGNGHELRTESLFGTFTTRSRVGKKKEEIGIGAGRVGATEQSQGGRGVCYMVGKEILGSCGA